MQSTKGDAKATRALYKDLGNYRGSIKLIAKRAGVSREWVRVVLQGSKMNSEIVKIAAEVLLEFKKKKQHHQKLVEQALKA